MLKSGCTLRRESAAARWDCAFESHQGLGFPSLVECYVLPGLRQITCPVESYRVWCVQLSVISKPQ